jgi:hypothetical protein
MSTGDFARLDELERRIAVAWDEAALALDEIKTAKLYRTTRDGQKQTWDEYCHRIHGFTPQWANTLIKRAKQLQRLNAENETSLSLSPTAVGHLEGLPPHEQAEVVKAVTKDGQAPRAKDVAKAKATKQKHQQGTPGQPTSGQGTTGGHQNEDDNAKSTNGSDSTGDPQHIKQQVVGHETGEEMVEELERIAQRLSEINQDAFGKIHWTKVCIRQAKNALAAMNKSIITISKRLNDEKVAA